MIDIYQMILDSKPNIKPDFDPHTEDQIKIGRYNKLLESTKTEKDRIKAGTFIQSQVLLDPLSKIFLRCGVPGQLALKPNII